MNEIANAINELRTAAATITRLSELLYAELLAVDPNAGEMETPAPEKTPAPTLEAVRAILAEKSRDGHTAEIRTLLQKYGATKLSGVDPANYKALLADAEELTNAT